ncbi:ribbon-helix-helix domain-containing protein [Actinocorallia populi]|uniref:hypothetical protein n=1 Tax=Actinocorallia populi TaxID=2079200 RepID=UPI000D093F82|nr:hypothetical protein [Actinocorallia populi]
MSKAETSIKERITVNLTPKTTLALDELVKRSGDTKTDTINRALQLYEFLDGVIRDGGKVYVQEPGSDEPERVRFL